MCPWERYSNVLSVFPHSQTGADACRFQRDPVVCHHHTGIFFGESLWKQRSDHRFVGGDDYGDASAADGGGGDGLLGASGAVPVHIFLWAASDHGGEACPCPSAKNHASGDFRSLRRVSVHSVLVSFSVPACGTGAVVDMAAGTGVPEVYAAGIRRIRKTTVPVGGVPHKEVFPQRS